MTKFWVGTYITKQYTHFLSCCFTRFWAVVCCWFTYPVYSQFACLLALYLLSHHHHRGRCRWFNYYKGPWHSGLENLKNIANIFLGNLMLAGYTKYYIKINFSNRVVELLIYCKNYTFLIHPTQCAMMMKKIIK